MKRIIAILVAATVSCLSLAGCGGGKPNDVSQEMYDIGIAALQVADDYMAYKIDGIAAKSKIDTLSDDANTIYERNNSECPGDYAVSFSISMLSYYIFSSTRSGGVPSDIKEARDDLAKELGK